MPRQILVLDSSQIATWGECNQQWNLKYNENLTSSNNIREDMAQGTYGHKLLELYYTNKALGLKTADAWHDANMFHAAGDFPLSTPKREFVHKRCWEYVSVYSQNDIIPMMGQPEKRVVFGAHLPTLDTTIAQPNCKLCGKTLSDYTKDETCPQNPQTKLFPKPLVEQGFSYPLLDTNEYLFVLEGRIDVMATLNNGSAGVVDHKFQGRERALYGKSIQFRNYAMVCDFNYVVINYIRLHQAISEKTFVRETIYFSSLEKQLWKRRLIQKFKNIADQRALANERGFEKEESACSGKFGYPCEFTKICNDNHDLISINAVKEQFYQKREVWKPW